MATNKELVPDHQPVECAVCERTILKGERPESYLVRDGGRRMVCELCRRRAEHAGWIRESASPDTPTTPPRFERRQSLRDRFRRKGAEGPEDEGDSTAADEAQDDAEPEQGASAEPGWQEQAARHFDAAANHREPPPERSGPRDPRHVRAVPTNQDVKIAHALDLFNQSNYAHTVAGLCRTLGGPWVCALPMAASPSEVSIVVAWEISWYQYRVDLGDVGESVILVAKGDEVEELDAELRRWNATALTDGTLAAGLVSAE
ncbi:MAG: hypothetical protein QOG62_1079 [Thermoleophilaceae bacterium]|jgi:hypothetical protein|nr:hypothetical protein [Thermoleophilaceae bacterium]